MGYRLVRGLAVALSAWLVAAPSAYAQGRGSRPDAAARTVALSHLRGCDGYGELTRTEDGMSTNGTWLRAAPNHFRAKVSFSSVGLRHCDSAIEWLDEQYPQYTERKVSLLQGRAVHRLVAKDPAGAIKDLDAARALSAGLTDAYFDRSLGLNNDFIRAFALIDLGDREAGESLAMETWARRPLSRGATLCALTILGPEGSEQRIDTLLTALARIEPRLSSLIFIDKFETGRFSEALDIADELRPPLTVHNQSYDFRTTLTNAETDRDAAALFDLGVSYRKAYALTALGRPDEARAVLAKAQEDLDLAMTPPNPVADDADNRELTNFAVRSQGNLTIKTGAADIARDWSALISARRFASTGQEQDAKRILDSYAGLPPTYAVLDILSLISPEERGDMEKTIPKDRLELPDRDAAALFARLMDTETYDLAVNRAKPALFSTKEAAERGYCQETGESYVVLRTICYLTDDGTPAVAEDHAVMRAAQAMAAEGVKRFSIQSRRDIRHQIVSTYYSVPTGVFEAGFESRLEIRAVEDDEACWRCLNVDEVLEQFKPIYLDAKEP